jgi:alpha-galactosidase
VVFGAAAGGMAQASAALRTYLLDGVRGGRPLTPLVTYNTWYAYGTQIDETSMRDEMQRASARGAELFVIDAGWYPNTGVDGPADFDAGLGGWTPDADRFPNGLAPLRDYAHRLGMKFGLWVEPERVSLALVGGDGVRESWLATTGGEYGSDHAAQICLAGAAARQWLFARLTGLIDEVQPDYLKWDNNMFVNCDRAGHGHGSTDGNFGHVNALYGLLSALRDRYPDLLIENVSGGGNRLDVGMLRYSDVGWMDDRTAPSVHVRHNLEGLSAVFPPAYLLSFVIAAENEPLHHDAPDMALYIRSRMPGLLGLTFRAEELDDQDEVEIVQHVDVYKRVANVLRRAAGVRLTGQAVTDAPAWDAMEVVTAAGDAVLFAYQMDPGVARVTLRPYGLRATAAYTVESADAGIIGAGTGESLMTDGIEISQGVASDAHILFVRRARTPR